MSDMYVTHSGIWDGTPSDGDVWMHFRDGDTDMGDMMLSQLRRYMKVHKVEPGTALAQRGIELGLFTAEELT